MKPRRFFLRIVVLSFVLTGSAFFLPSSHQPFIEHTASGLARAYEIYADNEGNNLHWSTGDFPIGFRVFDDTMPVTDGLGAVYAAFDTWGSVPSSGVLFDFRGSTEATDTVGEDGVNLVIWVDDPSAVTADLVIVDWIGETPEAISAVALWLSAFDGRIKEFDIALKRFLSADWTSTGAAGRADIQGMLTHAIGHAIGLGHSDTTAAVMQPLDGMPADMTAGLRELGDDDEMGAAALYPVQGVPFTPGEEPTSSSGGGGGCFIATAAFGGAMTDEVLVLRHFRDEVLLKTPGGALVVGAYQQTSPIVADIISRSTVLRIAARLCLRPLAWELRGIQRRVVESESDEAFEEKR